MTDDIFKKAREAISPGLIERMFSSAKSKWEKGEYWTLSPLRSDKSIGSFHISENGLYIDHATNESGDLIDLVCAKHNMSKHQAAEYIIEQSGGVTPEKKSMKNKKEKLPAVIPIPIEALQKLNDYMISDWMVKNIGVMVCGWEYHNSKSELCFVTVRHEKDGEKNIRPYYWSGKRWEHGNPFKKNIPLYGLKRDLKKPILIVEGEKCADIQVDGYTVLTWCGGPGQIKKADWKPLIDLPVTIWPDFDQGKFHDGVIKPDIQQPGLAAAIDIKNILPQAKILNTYNLGKPPKWDIYDANQDGIDLIKFIDECGEYEIEGKNTLPENDIQNSSYDTMQKTNTFSQTAIQNSSQGPFRFMGFDDACHYFLPSGSRTIKKIGLGSFSKSKLLELAPLSYWTQQFVQRKGYDFEAAVDWVIRESEMCGFFRPDSVRGTGIWRDENKIVINNGDYIINGTGKPLRDFNSKYFYVRSDRKMGRFDGRISTDDEGKNLINLFTAQGFETKIEGWIACGWSLIAPFAGILNWRPHIWITGPTECGKSYLLDNIIIPLCGPSVETGTGETTAPGIYRSLKSSSAPVVLDEMEPGDDKDSRKRVKQKLVVARNATSDSSATMTMASKSGGVDKFCVRSPFCLSSVVPYLQQQTFENRFSTCRLKKFTRVPTKKRETLEIMKTGIMDDPGIFRRRIYNNIETILHNTEIISKIIYNETLENRKAAILSPIFASFFNLTNDGKIDNSDVTRETISGYLNAVKTDKQESDEDKLMRYIFDYQVRTQTNENKSIAEMVLDCSTETTDNEINYLLMRNGLKIHNYKGEKYLAVSQNHQSIHKILENTQYKGTYKEILKRHPASADVTPTVRFAASSSKSIILLWDTVKNIYFNEAPDEIEESTMEIPF